MIKRSIRKGDRVDQHAAAHPSMACTEKVVGIVKGTNGKRVFIREYYSRQRRTYVYTAVKELALREFGKRIEPKRKPQKMVMNER